MAQGHPSCPAPHPVSLIRDGVPCGAGALRQPLRLPPLLTDLGVGRLVWPAGALWASTGQGRGQGHGPPSHTAGQLCAMATPLCRPQARLLGVTGSVSVGDRFLVRDGVTCGFGDPMELMGALGAEWQPSGPPPEGVLRVQSSVTDAGLPSKHPC